MAQIVKPETILAWHRTLVAQKFDGSQQRQSPGRPTIDQELEALIVRIAQENRSWGYDRIVGALANLGLTVSDQTVGNVLKRHGIAPAPERKTTTTWKEFIRTHMDVLVATDFFTAEVWTLGGLVTYYVLFFLHLGSREVHVAGVTPHPNEAWMVQVARNVTMEEWGFLSPGQYLIHDRDTKFCAAFQQLIDDAGVERVVLPPRSPNLKCLRGALGPISQGRVSLAGDPVWGSLPAPCAQRVCGRIIIRSAIIRARATSCFFRDPARTQSVTGPIQCRERLGGLLKYYTARPHEYFDHTSSTI